MRTPAKRDSAHYDVYDPPPAPEIDWAGPSARERLHVSRGDVACLVGLCLLLFAVAAASWRSEPILAMIAAGAGSLVVLESWFTALGFLQRGPSLGWKARWIVFLATLLPWLVGLGAAVAFMLGLFWVVDRFFTL